MISSSVDADEPGGLSGDTHDKTRNERACSYRASRHSEARQVSPERRCPTSLRLSTEMNSLPLAGHSGSRQGLFFPPVHIGQGF